MAAILPLPRMDREYPPIISLRDYVVPWTSHNGRVLNHGIMHKSEVWVNRTTLLFIVKRAPIRFRSWSKEAELSRNGRSPSDSILVF